jgi:hypothetical protein
LTHVKPLAHTVQPLKVIPPHWPYFSTGVHDGAVGSDGAALVTRVVGTGSGELDSTGAGVLLPEPFQTDGPGMG